jgi:hypothetical protein
MVSEAGELRFGTSMASSDKILCVVMTTVAAKTFGSSYYEIGRASSMHGTDEKYIQIQVGKLEKSIPFEIERRRVRNNTRDVVWGFELDSSGLETESVAGSCNHGSEGSNFV